MSYNPFEYLSRQDPNVTAAINDATRNREISQQAAVDTAKYSKQTYETIESIKSKVGDIETDLSKEREDRIIDDKSNKSIAKWGLGVAILSFLAAVAAIVLPHLTTHP